MTCVKNRRGVPHEKQENRRKLRQQRAAERAAEEATWTPELREMHSRDCLILYRNRRAA